MVKPTTLSCDWYQDLKMYQIPEALSSEIQDKFSNISLVPVNCPGLPEYDENSKIYFGNRIDERILSNMPEIEWVHFGSIGTDKLSFDVINKNKLTITNSRGTMEEAVAATALSFIFSLARGQKKIHNSIIKNSFGREDYDEFFSNISDVYGSKFCILGYGQISLELLKPLKPIAGQINIVTRTTRDIPGLSFFNYSEINQAVKNADFIINLLPHNENTENIINKEVISNFSEECFYINLGRCATNDEKCLVEAVYKNKIAGLGLDVFSGDKKLKQKMFKHHKIIVSPHVASVSKNYWKKQTSIIMWNLTKYFEEDFEGMKNLVYLKGDLI